MLTNQRIQKSIDEIKTITKIDAALFNMKARPLAFTREVTPDLITAVSVFADSEAQMQTAEGCTFFMVDIEEENEYVLVMYSSKEADFILGQMAVCQIRNLALGQAEKYDRNNFIQNILLGNLLAVDMVTKAKKLHIDAKPRVAFVIDTGDKNNDDAMELVKNLSNMKSGDFVTTVDTHSVVLVKDVAHINEENLEQELKDLAVSLVDNLHMEAMIKVRVGYGNVVNTLQGIAESYQEAKLALEVGRVFYAQKDTISYSKLGIGRLIYQLPMSLCDMFIKEVFGDKIPDILEDEEAMSTVNKFFENNLNISETARQLYVHRNTLVYRLERIEKAIGLDIRAFDDAMTFRIAIMVLAHMKEN